VQVQATPVLFTPLAKERIVDIAAGVDHVVALSAKGRVFCWGNGEQHQLGRRIVGRRKLSCLEPAQLGVKNVVRIGSGAYHSFAVTEQGKVFTWGLNNFGQCGIQDIDCVMTPTEVDGLRTDDPNRPPVQLVVGGEHHTLIQYDDGRVYSFGRSDSSQLGLGFTSLPDLPPHLSRFRKKPDDKTQSSGHKQCIPVPQLIPSFSDSATLCSGSHHNLAIDNQGRLYAWGFAEMCQLGNGKVNDLHVPTLITTKSIKDVAFFDVSGGGQHSLMLGAKLPPSAPAAALPHPSRSSHISRRKRNIQNTFYIPHTPSP
jgi:regulator of chromosome condensation